MKHLCLAVLLCLISSTAFADQLGYDFNGDGIWDDIDRYVDEIHPQSGYQRDATIQMVKALQHFIEDSYSKSQTLTNANAVQRALQCHFYCNQGRAQQIYEALKLVALQTQQRLDRYLVAEKMIQGEVLQVEENVELWGQSCNFAAPELKIKNQGIEQPSPYPFSE